MYIYMNIHFLFFFPFTHSTHTHKMSESIFALHYPQGVQLSPFTTTLLDRLCDKHTAITFDEVTLEDRPSDMHPNDVELGTYVSRNIQLKGCGVLSAAMDTVPVWNVEMCVCMCNIMGVD